MARLLQHSVEYIGSPPPNYSHLQQPPPPHAIIPPISPPQFSRGMVPGPYLQPAQPLPRVPLSNLPGPVTALPQPAQVTHIPLPPPNFAVMDSGSYPLTNMTALSPPSISWITHTQSPPLHPFPPPTTALTHVHSIPPVPPRLSHSPVVSPPGYTYYDPVYMQMHTEYSAQAHPNPHQAHHCPHIHPANLHIQHHGPPPPPHHHHHILSPPPGYPHQEVLSPPCHGPRPSPAGPHIHGTPQPAVPVVRDGWIRSPQPHQQHQFYQLPSALDHIPAMPQSLPIQFLPCTPTRPVTPRIRIDNVNGHNCLQPGISQVSGRPTSTTIQTVPVSTIVRPTPIHTSQTFPGLFPSVSSELVFPTAVSGPSSVSNQVSPAGQQWMTQSQVAMPTASKQTSSALTSPPQGSATDIVLEQTQPVSIPMSSHEAKELEEYTEFAAIFRNHRMKLGYTHADVIQQVGIRYGYSFSTDTIAQFEMVQLPLATVRALKSVLQMWLKDTVKAAGTSEEDMKEIIIHASTSINPKRERKRRTNVDSVIKGQLEEEFRRKRTPSQSEMQTMANRFGMEKEFIRVWFCNRRQRQKKLEKDLKTHAKITSVSSPKATIPSPSHDITVVVPSIDPRDAGSPIHEGYKFRRTD